jgi:Flp pilus assembly protein TadG
MNKKGQTLVEFALVSLFVFIPVLFAAMDLGIMLYVNLTMQQAVRQSTRYAITGRTDSDLWTETNLDRRSALIKMISIKSQGLYEKNIHVPKEPEINVITPSNVSFTNFSGTPTTGDPGKSNEVIVVSLTYSWPLLTPILSPFFPGGIYTFTVKSTMQNEFFEPL